MTHLLAPQIAFPVLAAGLALLARVVVRAAASQAGRPLSVSREWLSEHDARPNGRR